VFEVNIHLYNKINISTVFYVKLVIEPK